MQLYRSFDIGTAKPPAADRARAPHHLIDILDPGELFSAGEYRRRAEAVLAGIRERRAVPILVGGTGLYLRALIEGLFDGPRRSEHWRLRLEERARDGGAGRLHRILARLDPGAGARIAPADVPKVIRAIEVRLMTGRPLSAHLAGRARNPLDGYAFRLIGLEPGRERLHERIRLRVSRMYKAGIAGEVRRILEGGVAREAPAFRAIGYRHALDYVDGIIPVDEAIMRTERDTRRYAKRQTTWFRKQHAAAWFQGVGGDPAIQARVLRFLDGERAGPRTGIAAGPGPGEP